jgi:two-component system, NarL family, nitrate/nitrite response regulator NarL
MMAPDTPEVRTIRLLLVDDHALFREGLTRLLGAETDFQVVGQCSTVKDALDVLSAQPVDVVLLDVDLGPERGSEFMTGAHRIGFRGRVLVVTAGLRDDEAAFFLREGAAGIFLKHDSPAVLARSIRRVMDGEASIDQRLLAGLMRSGGEGGDEPERAALTERERGVLRGVFEGQANKEIAAALGISESSVKAALQQLFQKTGVRTRSQLVRIALEQYRDQL